MKVSKIATVLAAAGLVGCLLLACSSESTSPTPAGDAGTGGAADGASTTDGAAATDGATGVSDAGGDASKKECNAATGKVCSDCHKAQGCNTVDNPCNDDATCNDAENAWFACICFAAAGTGTGTACDDTFKTSGGANANAVVDCVRSKCAADCY